MGDLHGVMTSAKKTTVSSTNIFGPPKTGLPLYYNEAGFVTSRTGHMIHSMVASQPVTAADLRAATTSQNIQGAYLDATLNPVDTTLFFPDRIIIAFAPSAARSWTLSAPANFIADLKKYYGAQNITAGLYWTITVINSSNTFDLTIIGANNSTNFVLTHNAATNWVSCTMRFYVTNVTPGAEAVTVFIT